MTIVPSADYENLVARVERLEKWSVSIDGKIAPATAMLLAEEAGARKAWWRNTRTGGTNALDGINGANLSDGDLGVVAILSGSNVDLYFYIYDSDNTSSESDPRVIEPDTGGSGAWLLCDVHANAVESDASGDAYILVNNSATPSSPSEGWIWYDTTDNRLEYYNGTNVVYIQPTGALVGTE